MALVKHISATQSQIAAGATAAGQLVFTSDTRRLYWDVDSDTRVEITDIIELPDETARIALSSPINKLYFVLATGVLWRYQGNAWCIVGSGEGEQSVISSSQPTEQKTGDTWLEVLV